MLTLLVFKLLVKQQQMHLEVTSIQLMDQDHGYEKLSHIFAVPMLLMMQMN